MAVTTVPVGVGAAPDDDTGDPARTAFTSLNTSVANLKAAVDLSLDVPQDRILGRVTASTGDVEQLTASQARSVMNVDVAGTDNSNNNAGNTLYSGWEPAIKHNSGTPVLTSGSTAAEIRTLIACAPLASPTFTGTVSAPTFNATSAERYKTDILNWTLGVDLQPLQPVTYVLKEGDDGRTHLGYIAEDVARLFPEVVTRNAGGQVESMDYSRMVVPAIAKINELENRLERLEALLL
jgi:hypothetical protein